MEFEKKVVELDVNDVLPNRFQPRIKFNEDSINELCESIKEHGVIQPIVVRSMGDKYEIIAGERRYKASLLAGKRTIPAVITNLNDKDSAEVALIENVQRKDLTPIEEAISYKKILDMGYLTQEELAVKLGKTQSTVANKLRLLNLDEEVQEAVLEEKISERHARSLLKLSDVNQQRKMLSKIIENRLTVRRTDEEIAKVLNREAEDEGQNEKEMVKAIPNPFVVEKIPAEKLPVIEPENIVNSVYDIEEPIIIIEEPDEIPVVAEDQVAVDPSTINSEQVLENFNIDDMNIPSAPISDSVPSTQPEKEPEINVNEQMNPGFMNIEAIENNAKDINEEKESVDLNSLLKPSIVGEEVRIEAPAPVEEQEEPIKAGKFFSLPTEEEKETSKAEAPASAPTGISDAFDFEKNMIGGTELMQPESTLIPESLESADSVTLTPSVEFNNINNNEMSISEDEIALSSNVNEPASASLESSVNFDSLIEVPEETAKVEENIILENTETPSSEVAPGLEMLDAGLEENLLVKEPVPSEQAIADLAEATNNLINPDFDITVNVPVERQELTATEVMSSEDMPIPTLEAPSAPLNTNIAGALEDVRDLVDNLEKDNYGIAIEEFDFEKEYQIIIKIQK